MSSRKIIVTGATGFVGSHLVPRLLQHGDTVAVVVRPSTEIPDWTQGSVTTIIDDGYIGNLTEQIRSFSPEITYHLATYFVGVHKPGDVNGLIESNVGFGTRLLEALNACDNDPALVNVGTVWQHVDSRPYAPASLYAATKQAFRDIAQFYAECNDMRVVSLELTDTYGPGDTRKKLLNLLLETAETGNALQMSPGGQLFDILHIDDVIDGLISVPALASSNAPDYALFNEEPLQLKRFVEIAQDVVGKPIPIEWGAKPYRAREMLEAWRATPLLPGWTPKVELEEGLRQLVHGGI